MGNPQERLLSIEFVAGLIVGEGWFSVTIQKHSKHDSRKFKYGFTLRPRFAIEMKDPETMKKVKRFLEHHEIAHYVGNQQGTRISIAGLKRMKKWLDFITPHLTGQKRKAAELTKAFTDRRLRRKAPSPYDEAEFEMVRQLRDTNAGNGKHKGRLDKLLGVSSEAIRQATDSG